MKKSIGKNTLGAGRKMQVSLKEYERSTHDLGYVWRSTMAAGTLVPFMKELVLPGDTYDIDLQAEIQTHPTVGPLFGSFKVQLDIFECPLRLYHAMLHNNAINIGLKMADVKLPQVFIPAPGMGFSTVKSASQINPSSIWSYLGIKGNGLQSVPTNAANRQWNAVPWLAYWDIFKNYYANKQETEAFVIHRGAIAIPSNVSTLKLSNRAENLPKLPTIGGVQRADEETTLTVTITSGTQPTPDQIYILVGRDAVPTPIGALYENYRDTSATVREYYGLIPTNAPMYAWRYVEATDPYQGGVTLTKFPLVNIDTMREKLLQAPTNAPFVINSATALTPYTLAIEQVGGNYAPLSTQEGLAVKTYQSDLFNNWMKTEWIGGSNGIAEVTKVSTASGGFTMDQLNLSKKVYDMLNRIAISGGTYMDWVETVWTHNTMRVIYSPVYHGGLSKELVFQEVISNSAAETDGTSQPLGTLGGRGVLGKKHKGGRLSIKISEPGYLIGIVSLTPRIDYSQGNEWDMNLKTMDDLHKPALDEIGFQDLITDQMHWSETRLPSNTNTPPTFRSAGKQPAWVNYMTNVNRTYGNFAIEDNEMFMTLNRRYEIDPATGFIVDQTTYIDPAKYNFIFADTARDSQNFWTQLGVNITARRKMSARIMPNL